MEVEEADQGPSRVISMHEADRMRSYAALGGCYPTLRWALFGFENRGLLIRKLACSVAAFQRAFVLLHDIDI